MRGLKPKASSKTSLRAQVASFTDAWIETKIEKPDEQQNTVASFTDAWIETIIARVAKALALSHLLQMRGLKRLALSVYRQQ